MWLGVLSIIGVVALWGIIPVLTKFALDTLDPFSISFLRTLQGFVILTVFYRLGGGKLRNLFYRNKWLLIGGVGHGINYIFYTLGLNYTTATAGVLLIQIQSVVFIGLSVIVLRERISVLKVIAVLIVVFGVFFVLADSAAITHLIRSRYILGNVFMLLSAIGWGLFALSNKVLSKQMGILQIIIPFMAIGVIMTGSMTILQFELRSSFSFRDLLILMILGIICTGGSFYLVSEGIRRLSASLVGTMVCLSPLLAIVLARFMLNESLSLYIAIGTFLIVTGISGIAIAESRKTEPRKIESRRGKKET